MHLNAVCYICNSQPQYIFIHDALDELILCGDTSFDVQNLRVKINRMSKIIPGININAFQEQFEVRSYIILTNWQNFISFVDSQTVFPCCDGYCM